MGANVTASSFRLGVRSRISSLDAGYGAFKSALLAMANICEGLPWPLKALPQTILQLLKHAEVSDHISEGIYLTADKNVRASQEDITTLLRGIQSLWNAVMPLCGPTGPVSAPLQAIVQEFFTVLLRTVLRLRVVQALSHVKAMAGVENVKAVLSEELQALETARTTLQVELR
jgi:hypothetical protein